MTDPTLFNYSFWMRWQNQDFAKSKRDNWNLIKTILDQAWIKIHSISKATIPQIEITADENLFRAKSQRLAGSDWLHAEDWAYLYESRALLDSVYLQIGVARAGEYDENIISELVDKLKKSFDKKLFEKEKATIGNGVCFYAEYNKNSEEKLLAYKCLNALSPLSEDEILTFSFSWGKIAVHTKELDNFVVLSNRSNSAIAQSSTFINYVLPRLMLASYKSKLEYLDYETSLRRAVEQIEQKLSHQLKGREKMGNLNLLEKRTILLSERQDELVENLVKVKQKLITIKANITNIELILNDSITENEQKKLFYRFGEPWQFASEQIELDLSYFQSRKEEAKIALQTMQIFVDIKRGKTERIIVILLALMGGLIAIGDTLSEISFYTRLGLIILGIVVSIVIWVTRKK